MRLLRVSWEKPSEKNFKQTWFQFRISTNLTVLPYFDTFFDKLFYLTAGQNNPPKTMRLWRNVKNL